MKKVLQLMLPFVFLAFCSHAQHRYIDSTLNVLKHTTDINEKTITLYHLAFRLADINPDSAAIVGRQAVQLSIKYKNDSNYEASNNALGWAYYRSEKYDSAENCFQKAIATCQKLNMKKAEGRVRLNLVTVFESKKNYQRALEVALPITELFEREKDDTAKAYTEKEIGIIYRDMGQLEKAKTYFQSALSNFKSLGNEELYMTTLPSLGSLYYRQANFDSALDCYRIVLKYAEKHPDVNLAFAFENIGEAFFGKAENGNRTANTDSALYYYQCAKTVFEKSGGISDVAYEEIDIGRCLRNLKRYKEAILYLTRSLDVFRKGKETGYAFIAATELSNVYNDMGEYNLAFKYLQESNTYKDSLDADNNKEKIAAMFAQYETDKKDRTILLLNTQQKLYQQQISRQHITTIFMVSVALFGVFIGLILWNRKGIKQRLMEVEMRNQLSSDLHDDIGSSLSSILLLSTMAAQKKDDTEVHNTLLDKIKTNAKEVIDRMSDIVWTMNPKYDEGESLRERIENYISRLKEMTTVTISGNIDKKIDQYHFSMELRKNIFLIIKEAMNNALKYANATLLQLDLITEGKYFEIVIKDNGIGFAKAETPNGNGLETMINRAKASCGECSITSSPGNGTVVKAIIPIPHIR